MTSEHEIQQMARFLWNRIHPNTEFPIDNSDAVRDWEYSAIKVFVFHETYLLFQKSKEYKFK